MSSYLWVLNWVNPLLRLTCLLVLVIWFGLTVIFPFSINRPIRRTMRFTHRSLCFPRLRLVFIWVVNFVASFMVRILVYSRKGTNLKSWVVFSWQGCIWRAKSLRNWEQMRREVEDHLQNQPLTCSARHLLPLIQALMEGSQFLVELLKIVFLLWCDIMLFFALLFFFKKKIILV